MSCKSRLNTQLLLVFVFFTLFATRFVISAPLEMPDNQPDKPNFVILLTDDQALCTLGCYGNPSVQTPHIDALAKRGMIFDSHYVTTAICMASRCNIMTGLYEYRTGCNFTKDKLPLDLWHQSYPMLLKKHGYRIGFAGKFGFEIQGLDRLPADSFDMWGGGEGQTSFSTKKNKSMSSYAEKYPHATLSYGAFGRDFVSSSAHTGQPFCLSISFKAPHRPVTPDPKFDEIYRNVEFPKPKNFGRAHSHHLAPQGKTFRQYKRFKEWGYSDRFNEVMRDYHQLVYAVDQAVGMIVSELESKGLMENTVIVFTSDNGYMCGSHGYGSKVIPYEESVRVPLIICHPGTQHAGARCQALTGNIDIPATIFDIAEIASPNRIDGVSIKPLLESPDQKIREQLELMNFWGPVESHYLAVVTEQWKYVYWFHESETVSATEELFDRKRDPYELANAGLATENLDELNSMRKRLDRSAYRIGVESRTSEYRIYKDLFDRQKPWSEKAKLLQEDSSE
ncbi:MAG: sulfatase [Planctomycetota bacterium]